MKHVLKLKAEKTTKKAASKRQAAHAVDVDELLDEALIETFPASDPVALTQPSRRRRAELQKQHAGRRH